MGTVAAIAGALTALVGVVMWILHRKDAREAKANEPDELNRTRRETIANEIVHDDEVSANRSIDADVREYEWLFGPQTTGGDPKGPGGEPAKGRANDDSAS